MPVPGSEQGPPEVVATKGSQAEQTSAAAAESDKASSAKTTPERQEIRVFKSEGASQFDDAVVDEVACLCGHLNPVRLRHYSENLYCESCGTQLNIGQPLRSQRGNRQQPTETASETKKSLAATSVPVPSKWRQILSTLVTVSLGIAGGAYLIGNYQPDPIGTASSTPPNYTNKKIDHLAGDDFAPELIDEEAIGQAGNLAEPFQSLYLLARWKSALQEVDADDPRLLQIEQTATSRLAKSHDVMLAQINALSSHESPTIALSIGEGWRAVLRTYSVAMDDPRSVGLQRVMDELTQATNPITMAKIDDLLTWDDKQQALVQTSAWLQRINSGDTANDPRAQRLTEVRKILAERISPVKPAPQYVDEFIEQLDSASRFLDAGDLDDAKEWLLAATELGAQHPGELASYKPRLELLQHRLSLLEGLRPGVARIESLLEQADELAQREDTTRALERWAAAGFLSAGTNMTQQQADHLRQMSSDVASRIRFARGRQAINDAQVCDRLGDQRGRNRAVRRAFNLLSGLPAADSAPLLTQLADWKKDSLSKIVSDEDYAPISESAVDIYAREQYYDALAEMGTGQAISFLAASTAIRKKLSEDAASTAKWRMRLDQTVMAALNSLVVQALAAKEDGLETTGQRQMDTARRALDAADAWKTSPNWIQLDRELRLAQ